MFVQEFIRSGLPGQMRFSAQNTCLARESENAPRVPLADGTNDAVGEARQCRGTHARYVIFQLAEVAVPKRLFRAILERIRRLRLPEAVPE